MQVFLHQPVDEALDLFFDLFWNIGKDLLLELSPDLVTAYQVVHVGEAQGGIEEIEAAPFKAVQNVLNFSEPGRKFTSQFTLVGCDDSFQRCGGYFIFLQGFRLGGDILPGLFDQALGYAQWIIELEFQACRVIQRGSDELLQVIEAAVRSAESGSESARWANLAETGTSWG